MKALVMSGAANYGTMQAGALDPIFLSGFKPEMKLPEEDCSLGNSLATEMPRHNDL